MWSASVALLVLLGAAGCRAELPKSTPQCSKDWGGWWDAYNCGNYPLHWAVASGNMKLVKELLDANPGMQYINKRDEQLWTPLVEAAFFGKQFISVELLRRGASLRDTGYMGLNIVKVAKLKWCVGHSQVNTCPTTLYDYDRTVEVLFRGCEWTECETGFRCVGRQCWPDKCHNVKCGTNAGCVVENRNPVCRCNAGFVGEDPKKKCEEISGEGKTGLETGNLVLDPCPEGYYIFGSQCLYIDDMKAVTWNHAVKLCKTRKGLLAKIENPKNFSSYLNDFYPRMSFWLGANDKKKEGVWRWQSGELLADEFPWGKNNNGKQQPNNARNNEHCMSSKYFNPKLGVQYVDNRCTLKHYYVCEAPRNYVDEVSSVNNSVYSTIESNSSTTGNNHNNSTNNNTASETQREIHNVQNESESSNANSATSDVDQVSNSSRSGNSENNNDISVMSDTDQDSNSSRSDYSESSNGNSVTSGMDQNSNSSRSGNSEINDDNSLSNDINENGTSTRIDNNEIRNDNSVTNDFDQNSNSTRSGNNNSNLTGTSNQRNKRGYGEYDSNKLGQFYLIKKLSREVLQNRIDN